MLTKGDVELVKIDNAFGDIKIGKQGDCAYQLHYGKQIRRLISPKRVASTIPQINQRSRFIAALTWRKTLTLDEKRYLDGYAIYHRLVDSMGVTLTWDKLAVRFASTTPTIQILYRFEQ